MEARRLQRIRKMAGLSGRQLAILSGYAHNYTAMIERGVARAPAFEVMARVARVLGISLDWLAYGEGEPPTKERALAAIERARALAAAPSRPRTRSRAAVERARTAPAQEAA